MRLVAISGKRRSGKTTLGAVLAEKYSYHPISLAAPLKAMCQTEFGLTFEQTDGAHKESATAFRDQRHPGRNVFLSPREIMIHMGQAYRFVDPDYWTRKLFEQMKQIPQAQLKTFVVTDMRFKNELEYMRRHQAFLVRLERSEDFTGPSIQDVSETELDNFGEWHLHIPAEKNETLADLYTTADLIHDHLTAHDRF